MDAEKINKLSGSETFYNYRILPVKLSDEQIAHYCNSTRSLFAPIAKSFDDEKYTEWMIRNYIAVKYILAATLLANSALYSEKHNVKIVLPYLNYYATLNCCRAFLLTTPCVEWKGATTLEMTHNNIINTTANNLHRLDANSRLEWQTLLKSAQEQRELFSYRFPGSGLQAVGDDLFLTSLSIERAKLLAELAQLNSACLEASIRKHKPGKYQLLEGETAWLAIRYEYKGDLIDDDDHCRISYLAKKYDLPTALIGIATEGLTDDFFGAWYSDTENGFDPDQDRDLLLDFL